MAKKPTKKEIILGFYLRNPDWTTARIYQALRSKHKVTRGYVDNVISAYRKSARKKRAAIQAMKFPAKRMREQAAEVTCVLPTVGPLRVPREAAPEKSCSKLAAANTGARKMQRELLEVQVKLCEIARSLASQLLETCND